MDSSISSISLVMSILVIQCCSCFESADERELTKLNLVLVTLDTFRADVSRAYGSAADHTPHLDQLASEGTVYANAYSPIATTLPAHASMLTGLYPRGHGLRSNGARLDEAWITLPEVLREAGYDTAAFVSYKNMVHQGGMGQGFDVRSPVPTRGAPPTRRGDEVNSMAEQWLETLDSGPFFLWVHYFESHIPYEVTSYSEDQLEDYAGPLENGVRLTQIAHMAGGRATAEDRRALRKHYEGEIREADRLLGDLLSLLEKKHLRGQTLLIVVADHGELLGEHDVYGHGKSLWEEALRIPFIISDPRESEGRRVPQRVSLVDLMPTALALLGIDAPDQGQGRSLASSVRGDALQAQAYFAEARRPDKKREKTPEGRSLQARVSIYLDRYKLTLNAAGQAEIHDLLTDPGEKLIIDPDLTPEKSTQFEEMESLARAHQSLTKQALQRSSPRPDPETLRDLRMLGYLE